MYLNTDTSISFHHAKTLYAFVNNLKFFTSAVITEKQMARMYIYLKYYYSVWGKGKPSKYIFILGSNAFLSRKYE